MSKKQDFIYHCEGCGKKKKVLKLCPNCNALVCKDCVVVFPATNANIVWYDYSSIECVYCLKRDHGATEEEISKIKSQEPPVFK